MQVLLKRALSACFSLLIALPSATFAQTAQTAQTARDWEDRPQSQIEMQLSFAIRSSATAVAGVRTPKRLSIVSRHFCRPIPFFEPFFGRNPNRIEKQSPSARGSSRGELYCGDQTTCRRGANAITVAFRERPVSSAKVVLRDDVRSCGLKIETKRRFRAAIAIRMPVRSAISLLALGNPFGVGHNVDERIVSRFSLCPQPGGQERIRLFSTSRRMPRSIQAFRRRF